jgi:hypothetical protein
VHGELAEQPTPCCHVHANSSQLTNAGLRTPDCAVLETSVVEQHNRVGSSKIFYLRGLCQPAARHPLVSLVALPVAFKIAVASFQQCVLQESSAARQRTDRVLQRFSKHLTAPAAAAGVMFIMIYPLSHASPSQQGAD